MKPRSIYRILWLVPLLLAIVFSSCRKDEDYYFPTAHISLSIRPNSTMYLELNAVGGWTYLDAPSPSRGVLVYRKSLDEFMAYERRCPHDPMEDCAIIEVEPGFSLAVDSCCMSRFLLLDGSVFSGPSKRPMVQYFTEYNGVDLYIHN